MKWQGGLFLVSHEGCSTLSQTCRNTQRKFQRNLCKYPLSNPLWPRNKTCENRTCENWPSPLPCTFSWALENFSVSTLVGVFVGTLWCALHRKSLNLRGHFRGHFCVHSRGHFREHFRERVRGSNFAVRVLCALLTLCWNIWFICFLRSLGARRFGSLL